MMLRTYSFSRWLDKIEIMVQEERMVRKRRREGGEEGWGRVGERRKRRKRERQEKENEIEEKKNIVQRIFCTATVFLRYQCLTELTQM